MDCVKLYYKDNLIGVLTYLNEDKKYVFVKNKFFDNKYIDDIMGINNTKEVYYSDHLFSFFLTFLKRYGKNSYTYKDLINIAHYHFNKEQFWIGV